MQSLGLPLALATGTAVTQCGLITFVGLAAPHLVRALHRWLLLLSAGMSAVLLLSADLLARWLIAPQEPPVGVFTAVLATLSAAAGEWAPQVEGLSQSGRAICQGVGAVWSASTAGENRCCCARKFFERKMSRERVYRSRVPRMRTFWGAAFRAAKSVIGQELFCVLSHLGP